MTDYYPFLGRAIAGLKSNTGAARLALYDRARAALMNQLRNKNPPLAELEIARERRAFEEAIRTCEAEAAQREAQRPLRETGLPRPAAAPRPAAPPRPAALPRPAAPAPPAAPARPAPPPRPVPSPRPTAPPRPATSPRPAAPPHSAAPPPRRDRAHATPAAYQPTHEPQPREVQPRPLRKPPRGRSAEPPVHRPGPRAAAHSPLSADARSPLKPAVSRRTVAMVLIALFVSVGVGSMGFLLHDRIALLTSGIRPQIQQQRDAAPTPPKVVDRIGQDAQPAAAVSDQVQTPAAQPQQPPTVPQHVVLYEEDPADPSGKTYNGTVIWRTEKTAAAQGQRPELTVRCEITIPERRLGMTMSLRRNVDQAVAASHTMELAFTIPADFSFGGISSVPGILMKQAEEGRGAPLAGFVAKVASGFFVIGLSSGETEKAQNLQLLKERPWFDIPVAYNNGVRAVIEVEKGSPGERAFKEAFTAWGQ